jgi:NhaP-type Na+/H+ or K+/H+ antiporter
MSLAGGSMALVLVFWMRLQASTPVVIQALGGIVLGALVYWITALLLRVEESRRLAKLLLRRNRNGR